jgi:hypothetical protein
MPHLGVAESRTARLSSPKSCSGAPHSMSRNRPNKLGTPHCPGLSDKLLGWVMQFYSHLEIKAKSPRGSVHITEAVEAIVLQEGELWSVSCVGYLSHPRGLWSGCLFRSR